MAELWFYHLENASIDQALPELLTKLTERGGRALVCSQEEARLDHLDAHLWTFREDSFLPHGRESAPQPEDQPILLSDGTDNLNKADMLFCLDGADPGDVSAWERVVVMFEASDETSLARARALWAAQKKSDIAISYWRQNEMGRWERKA
ncbi:MAG: DNA polymerase III subunit chi [Oceanicaulis sp.]|uniref:DNA polymerase III subunit chi n=1 Tax=Oceanicaulis sp. UBA2681 TaxID=1947007 RepID=UPI000C0B1349|nr:DNA polymerase III subunit chi [Oceanicaulis sp. UBA2681]MAP48684.1 DNA polymerase III subunit chi [Oceanicaulis sp.]HCR65277.1 DNA polymerase III subunit chi [Oceanicaulis sp.]|tara:strand:+ start:3097 stop:3546 length:450 start_codon:yes stop_codon:yes gene_type:complete